MKITNSIPSLYMLVIFLTRRLVLVLYLFIRQHLTFSIVQKKQRLCIIWKLVDIYILEYQILQLQHSSRGWQLLKVEQVRLHVQVEWLQCILWFQQFVVVGIILLHQVKCMEQILIYFSILCLVLVLIPTLLIPMIQKQLRAQ